MPKKEKFYEYVSMKESSFTLNGNLKYSESKLKIAKM